MAWPTSTFPTALDEITDIVDNVSEAKADDINGAYDAIEKLEAKVGVDSSAVATSLDYRVDALETSVSGIQGSGTIGELSMTGEDHTSSSDAVHIYDLGSVTAGDRIVLDVFASIGGAAPTSAYLQVQVDGFSGEGSAVCNIAHSTGYAFATMTPVYGSVHATVKVTGTGTFKVKVSIVQTGGGSVYSQEIGWYFLKKA